MRVGEAHKGSEKAKKKGFKKVPPAQDWGLYKRRGNPRSFLALRLINLFSGPQIKTFRGLRCATTGGIN